MWLCHVLSKCNIENWSIMSCSFQTSLRLLKLALKWMKYNYKLFEFIVAICSKSKLASNLNTFVQTNIIEL